MDTPSTSFDRQRPGLFDTFRINDSDNDNGISDMDVDSVEGDFSETELSLSGGSDATASDDNARPAVRRPPPTPQARAHPPAVSHWTRVTPPEVQHNDASRPSFTVRNPGPRQVPARNSDPIKYFELFFDDDMMVHITRETNRYADTFLSNAAIVEWIRGHPHSQFKRWPAGGITVAQLKKYFGLSINMGLVVKKRPDNYWSTKPSQLTPFFSSVMPYSEFALIVRMLHVSDKTKEKEKGDDGYDPWQKVRPVLDRLNDAFKRHYLPQEFVSVDESMIGMKNRVVYIQYMPDLGSRNLSYAMTGVMRFMWSCMQASILTSATMRGKPTRL
nr:piggyBac transposable element-derived protein 4-like [Lytechinus pictus]